MDFNLFIYATVGRRAELEAGMAGVQPGLYTRMLDEIGDYVRFADQAGYAGFGHPEHHLQVEGCEASNDPGIMSMFIGSHSERLRVITCGFVSTTHNPLRVAENIATLDHMHKGRFGVGLVRGYQARWVENFKVQEQLNAVGNWNKDTPVDDLNRRYFTEWVEIVHTALTNETFAYEGEFWTFPNLDRNPHDHPVYANLGQGIDADMKVTETGIAPRPYQDPHPDIYGGFTGSMRTAVFWAKYGGKPIVLAESLDFCAALWSKYMDTAEAHGRVRGVEKPCWGGLMICADTDDKAQEIYQDMNWFWNTWAVPFGQPLPALLVGSPDTISAKIEAAQNAFPIDESFLLIPQGVHDRDTNLASLDLFATKVMPRFT